MKIRFEDGNEPVVELRKAEQKAIGEAARLCLLLGQRLDDKEAAQAAVLLTGVSGRYATAKEEGTADGE